MWIWEIAILLGISAGYGADSGGDPNQHFTHSSKNISQRTHTAHSGDYLDHQMFQTLHYAPRNVRHHLMGDRMMITPPHASPLEEHTVTDLIQKFESLFGDKPEVDTSPKEVSKVSDLINKFDFGFTDSAGKADGRSMGVTPDDIRRETHEIKKKLSAQDPVKSNHRSDKTKGSPS